MRSTSKVWISELGSRPLRGHRSSCQGGKWRHDPGKAMLVTGIQAGLPDKIPTALHRLIWSKVPQDDACRGCLEGAEEGRETRNGGGTKHEKHLSDSSEARERLQRGCGPTKQASTFRRSSRAAPGAWLTSSLRRQAYMASMPTSAWPCTLRPWM